MTKNTYCSYQELLEEFVEKLGYNENSIRFVIYQKDIYKYLRDSVIHKSSIEWNDEKQMHIETAAIARYDEYVKSGRCYGLIKNMIEEEPLPFIGNGLYWTPFLLADLLTSQGRLAIFGSERNAFLPVPNKFGIESFEDLVYEILNKEHDGAENLNSFSHKLRESGIIRKHISPSMLGKSEKVQIVGNKILLK